MNDADHAKEILCEKHYAGLSQAEKDAFNAGYKACLQKLIRARLIELYEEFKKTHEVKNEEPTN